ncbi:MAG: CRISPR-associated protein Cas4 [Muribaculaceae bacterium]|jgi:CRISPR-associated exonuclease Cas4|nr:CRISPR-associated protein Cas4 [Muribaculaceae bacterium]
MFSDEDMLMLSGIQHYMFCPRQWALIHIENQWEENLLTIEGQILHARVDDPFYTSVQKDHIILRSMPIVSHTIGLNGIADAVEMIKTNDPENAMTLQNRIGYWRPYPVEYKHGQPKMDQCDEVQLAAQVICIEEKYNLNLDCAYLYYAKTRHREKVTIDNKLRQLTKECAFAMHEIYSSKTTPPAKYCNKCRRCSLKEICMPKLCKDVTRYLKDKLNA